MLMKCVKMQIAKKYNSLIETVKFLAEHKEATIEEIAAYLKKDYTTALRIINNLSKANFLDSREEPTKAKGKRKRYYSLNFYGLENYLNLDQTFSNIREVAKAHSDKLLVFRKWDKFVENECEQALIANLKSALKMAYYTNYVLMPYLLSMPSHAGDGKEATLGFTSAILGFHYLVSPIEHVKEILGDKWEGQQKIWKVVENDYELRKVRESMMHSFEFECSEKMNALSEWRKYLQQKNRQEEM